MTPTSGPDERREAEWLDGESRESQAVPTVRDEFVAVDTRMTEAGASTPPPHQPERPLRVVVADDHPFMLEGVRGVLQREPDMVVVGLATRGAEVTQLACDRQPDALVLDFHLPDMDAPTTLRRLAELSSATRVVVLSVSATVNDALTALEAGAMGYILKEEPTDRLVEAIRGVMQGKIILTPNVAELVARHDNGGASRATPPPDLTRREHEVLALLARGQSNGEIAAHLSIGVKTVETHRTNLYRKLDVHNAGELIVTALRHRLISI